MCMKSSYSSTGPLVNMNTEAEVEAPAEARNMNLSQVAGEAKVGQSQSVIQRIRRGHGFSQQFSYAK